MKDRLTMFEVLEAVCAAPKGMTPHAVAEKFGVRVGRASAHLSYLHKLGKLAREHIRGAGGASGPGKNSYYRYYLGKP